MVPTSTLTARTAALAVFTALHAVASDPSDAALLLEEAIEAEIENAAGLHRYVFQENRLHHRYGLRGNLSREDLEQYAVAWIDSREIPELISVNGKKARPRDVAERRRQLDELMAAVEEQRRDEDGELEIPGWHLLAGYGNRKERHTFSLTKLETEEFELRLAGASASDGIDAYLLIASPSETVLAAHGREEQPARALFEHSIWIGRESRAWVRWDARAVRDGPVLAAGSRQSMRRTFVEDDIWIEAAIERTWLYRTSRRPQSRVLRLDTAINRFGFRRFYDVESAITYQEAIIGGDAP